MIKIEDSKDMRIVILLHLEDKDYALEQKISNDFLSELTTKDGFPDLGTIRRSLEDLLKEGFIMETHESKVIGSHHIFTSKNQFTKASMQIPENYDPKEFSNPQRFMGQVGNAPQITNIYLGITLKGKSFLTDRRNSEANQELISQSIKELKTRDTWWWRNKDWALVVIGSLLAILVGVTKDMIFPQPEQSPINIEQTEIPERFDINIKGDTLTISH